MKQRVRAILITPAGTTLFMKRVRLDTDPYWVVVGGGVEDSDASPQDALLREIREEIAGDVDLVRPFHELQNPAGEKELFYLARIETWNFADRTGPEFERDDRGEYLLEEVPLTTEAIAKLNLMPPEISSVLRDAITCGELAEL
ncbi:NUDIX domain-containing protein [Streptomyces californicus]|uniref:NUDIX domain-containing protein n=1 Tax=Streptomyces californicus TaxID=67351 RepID=UPI00296E6669|nr:NUDIX domain-containing protein [Streptomyces californicus]MDW4916274.1 NUDIX domain-containing protein [Streptomyces californicus]